VESYDLVVIGAGPGGYPAAIRAAQQGAKVALVEKELAGGTCLNWGCIPTKTLISAAELYAHVKNAAGHGIKIESAAIDYPAMIRRKNRVVEELREGIKTLLKHNQVKTIAGQAAFCSRNRLRIHAAGDEVAGEIHAEKIIIATGSTSFLPPDFPRHARIMDSREFLGLGELPRSVLILGGGVIGCEFASLLIRLEVKVTLVEILDEILAGFDGDLRKFVARELEKSGVRILRGQTLQEVRADSGSVQASARGELLKADVLLAALGRQPSIEGLALEKAGIKTNPKGCIAVNEFGQTSAANVYAVGDVTGRSQLAHAATAQGLTAVENLLGNQRRKNENIIPAAVFTSPEIGTAGLSEAEAAATGRKIKTGKFFFSALGKAKAMGETGGFVKIIADAGSHQLLGAAAVGTLASELIAEMAALIRAELTVEELAWTVHAHPTLAEVWRETAEMLLGTPIHAVAPLPRKPK
jgi:dihydrolipoamide dehydrogenase